MIDGAGEKGNPSNSTLCSGNVVRRTVRAAKNVFTFKTGLTQVRSSLGLLSFLNCEMGLIPIFSC